MTGGFRAAGFVCAAESSLVSLACWVMLDEFEASTPPSGAASQTSLAGPPKQPDVLTTRSVRISVIPRFIVSKCPLCGNAVILDPAPARPKAFLKPTTMPPP